MKYARLAPVALIGLVCNAYAQGSANFDTPEDAVRFRQAAFTLIGEHMGRIGNQLRSGKPDAQRVKQSAEFIAFVAQSPWETFDPITAKVRGTSARPEVWTQLPKFLELSVRLRDEAGKLATVAAGSDAAAVRSQFNAVGQSCKACHDDFKKK